MNTAERARLEYLQELPRMDMLAELGALLKTADYNAEFDARYERLVIRQAADRAHWQNVMLPLIKAAGKKVRSGCERPV